LVAHAEKPNLGWIATEADFRSLYRHAFLLSQRAAEDGDPQGVYLAAKLLDRAGGINPAMAWLQVYAEAGNHTAEYLLRSSQVA
jgi:hypothetical protein